MKQSIVRFGVCVTGVALFAAASYAGQYESPPTFSASQVLPPDLLRSSDYSIGDRVGLENFQYVFNVDSKWGPFVVQGGDLMRVRAREIVATAKLEEISGGDTAVNSAARTALKPVGTAKDFVTAPAKTVKDTFKGVGRIFGSADAAMSATDPHKETVLASVTGGATARRKLAFELGIDPNTSFPPLSAELKRVATASAVGETGVNVGLSFVAGPAGIAISAGGTSNTLREMLRDKTAADLEKEGRVRLAAIGVSPPAIDAFYLSPMLSPTDKAIIVEAMQSLGGAGGREVFIAGAANAVSIEMGFFYRRQAELIASFNRKVTPVRGFVQFGGAPMLETGKGTVSILPVDYLIWTPPLENLIAGAKGQRGEIWITGRASAIATAKLVERGWKIVPKAKL
ncbi:MAG TPA: hypothetical protein VIG52_07070 [Methyloceanibacter sp.]